MRTIRIGVKVFVARERELLALEDAWNRDGFKMVVVYGRRRVGKTMLIEEFAKNKRTLFFTGQQQSDRDNLLDFAETMLAFFGEQELRVSFASWKDALVYVARKGQEEQFLFVFDELPYAAEAASVLPSALQVTIDREFSKTNCMLVLCGSNQGFMESEVLGTKSPLYGRRTAQIRLEPFDYADAKRMLPGVSAMDALGYYATFGGTPYYLSLVRSDLGLAKNVARLFFDPMGFLFEEPLALLRQELREPATYNSIMRAIGSGETRVTRIANSVGIAQTSVSAYLKTLCELGLVRRLVPFGESFERSKRGIYVLADNCFSFWYRFVAPRLSNIGFGNELSLAKFVVEGDVFSNYMGPRFEGVCREWVIRAARTGILPFDLGTVGSWWGTDPQARERTDVDVVAESIDGVSLFVGECKWRNAFNETAALRNLAYRSTLIGSYKTTSYALFTKYPVSSVVHEGAGELGNVMCVNAEKLFEV